jgi:hypothetical protein
MANIEEWKQIVGFSYEVSSFGRIRRCEVLSKFSNSTAGRILKPWKSGRYLAITLIKDGRPYAFTVHKLVMAAFIGERPQGYVVHHMNGNSHDNTLSNLGYTDYSHNTTALDAGANAHPYKLSEVDCEKIKELHKELTGRRLAQIFKCSEMTISKVVHNKYRNKE